MFSILRKIRRGAATALLCGAAILLTHSGRAQVLTTNIMEFVIPTSNPSRPEHIVAGPDGGYWFTEYEDELNPGGGAFIGRMDPVSNILTQIRIASSSKPFGIVVGSSNTMFFTESSPGGTGIGRITFLGTNYNSGTNYAYTHFNLPASSSRGTPWTITTGPDGLLWFIEYNLNKIAAFSPNDTNSTLTLVHEYGPFPTNNTTSTPSIFRVIPSGLFGIVTGPDNNIWFTESASNIIARIDTNGNNYAQFVLPTNAIPVDIINGPDGALWFTEYTGNRIGRITTGGALTEFPVPLVNGFVNPEPDGLIVGPDSNLWFTENGGSAIARMTVNGAVTVFPTPTGNSGPTYLATGADSNIWFCEFGSIGQGGLQDNIGRIITAQALGFTRDTARTLPSLSSNLFNGAPVFTFAGELAKFYNSNTNNTLNLDWGDGTTISLQFTNVDAFTNFLVTNIVVNTNILPHVTNTLVVTNFLAVDILTNIDTNTGNNGTYVVLAGHQYITTNYSFITLAINDTSNDVATLTTTVLNAPAFFAGAVQIEEFHAFDFLSLPAGNDFGFYFAGYFPFILHEELGWEYVLDAGTGGDDCYLFDFTTSHWWYTSREDFPFVYDFSIGPNGTWLYYSPDVNSPEHYTTSPRWFFNFNTMTWFNQ